jgi:hypothetical protein
MVGRMVDRAMTGKARWTEHGAEVALCRALGIDLEDGTPPSSVRKDKDTIYVDGFTDAQVAEAAKQADCATVYAEQAARKANRPTLESLKAELNSMKTELAGMRDVRNTGK